MDGKKLREKIESSGFLLVYGTLLNEAENEYSHFLKNHSRFAGRGYFPGRLFRVDDYPGAIYTPENNSDLHYPVYGDILQLTRSEWVFEYLDSYEGIGPEYPHPQEYIRTMIPVYVETDSSIIDCWIYLYNLDTTTLEEIPTGNYF